MTVTLRNISTDDAATIAKLSEQLGYAMTIEETSHQIKAILESPNDIACVALADGSVAGWIHVFYTLRIECPSFCEIGGLVVDEKYRGLGIGKKLIDFIKPWCTAKKSATLRVRSNVKRNKAHTFYVQAGFPEIKQQKVFEITLTK